MAGRGRPMTFDRMQALRAAMDLFWERGYEGTSMKDLTEVMGIASASIYAAFGSKEELFRESVALNSATQGQPPRIALREQPTAYRAIEGMLRAAADAMVIPGSPRGCMLVLSAPTGAVENHPVRQFLADIRHAQQMEIRERLARGVTEGDIAVSEAGLDALARYYTTVLHGLSIEARDGANRDDLEVVIGASMAAWETLVKRYAAAGQRAAG